MSAHREDCIDFLQDLIAIPSASTVGEDETEIGQRIRKEMESLGYDEVFVDDIGNVHGVIEGERDDEGAVMFNSHIDTVGVGDPDQWEHDPTRPTSLTERCTASVRAI